MNVITLTVFEGGATPLVEVAGLPGHPCLWVYQDDAGWWRTVGHVRGIPVRLSERPPGGRHRGPALHAVLNYVVEGQ